MVRRTTWRRCGGIGLAAEQEDAYAQYALGFYYIPHDLDADAALQDYVQAHLWFNLAASRLTGDRRERTVTNRDRAASELTPAALNEAQRLAREWEAAHPR